MRNDTFGFTWRDPRLSGRLWPLVAAGDGQLSAPPALGGHAGRDLRAAASMAP